MKEKIFYEISAINFDDDKIIYKNYNSLMIHSGMAGKRFAGFRREIYCSLQEDDITEIPNELYEEKVVPKNDLICGISQEVIIFGLDIPKKVQCIQP